MGKLLAVATSVSSLCPHQCHQVEVTKVHLQEFFFIREHRAGGTPGAIPVIATQSGGQRGTDWGHLGDVGTFGGCKTYGDTLGTWGRLGDVNLMGTSGGRGDIGGRSESYGDIWGMWGRLGDVKLMGTSGGRGDVWGM